MARSPSTVTRRRTGSRYGNWRRKVIWNQFLLKLGCRIIRLFKRLPRIILRCKRMYRKLRVYGMSESRDAVNQVLREESSQTPI